MAKKMQISYNRQNRILQLFYEKAIQKKKQQQNDKEKSENTWRLVTT